MSESIKQVSQQLGESAWLLAWREAKAAEAEVLPKELKYGIGITGVLPEHLSAFDQTADYHVDASKGLEIYTWKEAVAQEEIAPILEGLLKSKFFPNASNYYSGVSQALFRSGLVVYVQPTTTEKGELVTEKLTLDTKVPNDSSSDLVIVIAKEGAKLDLTSSLSGGDDTSVFARTLLVLTERDAHVAITQRSSAGAMQLFSSLGIVAAHSSCKWTEIFSANAEIKSETDNQLIGEGAHSEIMQGIVGSGSARYDIFANTAHVASHTHSRIRAAGVADGASKVLYRGKIDMPARQSSDDGGHKEVGAVNGSQEARFLVLSGEAQVDAIPSLDIASNDVQCTHKLSISHVRDTDMFYPKLRGLSGEESKRVFLEGHFAGVLGETVLPDVSEALDRLSQ